MQQINHNNNNNNKNNDNNISKSRSMVTNSSTKTTFTNTAKLPIETVKLLIASVSRRPNLWIRTSNGQKRCDINALWQQVGQEVHLPADICRIKWGHLRDNFRKVFIRNTLSGDSPTTWRFYNDMRFMEAAVAENVMRQHRLRAHSLYTWPNILQQNKQNRHTTVTPTNLLELQASYERALHNPSYGLRELSAFFETTNETLSKRIKLEPSDSGGNMPDLAHLNTNGYSQIQTYAMTTQQVTDNNHNTNNSIENDDDDNEEEEDEEDDDDFDEDATSTENNYQILDTKSTLREEQLNMIKIEPNENIVRGLTNDNMKLSKNQARASLYENMNNISNKTDQNLSSTVVGITSNETITLDTCEQDSDRMFLLSLLPYLHKVNQQRKLKVRQKLQNVLIDEFG